ncbi:DUF2076 domain-containing protein [Noviherbaspirillum galbum]|uniref:DUF2076 family protein n=1 Tax=Noviherbaspirillum galbum TaxID=2709383 RepID=A0A6B3SMR6_9BURK|nr:DUF2076 domain-containing protein [Noviherbaspirillum galbum]NEX60006.1 DUF2076 family protein [Noviherbaspirillum galbum]
MNDQERMALRNFLEELQRARLQNKDGEADAWINQAVRSQPDAAYLLVQRALLQEQALNAAQQRIAALEQQLNSGASQPSGSGGFLDQSAQWGRSGQAFARNDAVAGSQQPMPARYGQAAYPQAGYAGLPAARPGLMGGGMGSFLGSMAGVAAGVAAGSFLYNGISNLMHHEGHHASGDPGRMGDFPESQSSSQFLDDGGTRGQESNSSGGGGDMAREAGLDDIGVGGNDNLLGDGGDLGASGDLGDSGDSGGGDYA